MKPETDCEEGRPENPESATIAENSSTKMPSQPESRAAAEATGALNTTEGARGGATKGGETGAGIPSASDRAE